MWAGKAEEGDHAQTGVSEKGTRLCRYTVYTKTDNNSNLWHIMDRKSTCTLGIDIILYTILVFVSVWGNPHFGIGTPLLFDTHQLWPYTKCRHHENFTQNFSWPYWKRSEVSTSLQGYRVLQLHVVHQTLQQKLPF